ncbi:multimerin-2a [Xenentodon cancila]
MAAVGELVLVLGLLVSAHCEVRARDPGVEEEEEEEELGRRGGGGGLPPPPGVTDTPFVGETGSYPNTRIGNWCSFMQRRVVKVPEVSGTETYVLKSQSPCPSGVPDCKLDMYKMSTRPVYKHKEKVLSALLWHCCPGHGGPNCDNSVSDPKLDSERSEPTRAEVQAADADEADPAPHAAASSYVTGHGVLSVPHMMTLFMSKLEHLNHQVGDLARDVAQLKKSQQGAQGAVDVPQQNEGAEEHLEPTLNNVFKEIKEVRRQMEEHRIHMEDRLHSQRVMLHHNLTSLKMDVDMKLKRHQKMLLVSLQAMNATLEEVRLDRDQIPDDEPEKPLPTAHPLPPRPTSDTTALWEAVARLDNMVVNNTVEVGGLMEDMEVTSGGVQQLTRHLKDLEKQINQTARNSQILFMETGLEVEGAKVTVLKRVEELAGNLTQHERRLQDVDVDVDYLYDNLYKRNSSSDCDCAALKAAMAHLERGVANVTELANENRLALDENSEGMEQWGGASDWALAVESLQNGLKQVRESLMSEQTRSGILELNLTQLENSLTSLQQTDAHLVEQMKVLSASFRALLEDAIRHSEVLQLLLGEEVLEFLEWSPQDQEALSIPALKEEFRNLQEQLSGQRGSRDEVPSADQPFSPPHHLPEWPPGGMRRTGGGVSARERQLLLLLPEERRHAGDGSDLWKLEKTVEQLEEKLVQLELRPCSCNNTPAHREAPPAGVEARLQAEVTWLKKGLEEHLRVFKNVFSNADVLVASDATLELDKLWQLTKKKDKKREGGRGGGRHRSRRDSAGFDEPSSLSDASLLFLAQSPHNVSNGAVAFKPSLNRGRFYSSTGTFTAPVDGIYLFLLTWDLRLGPAHVVLRKRSSRDEGGAMLTLQRQKAESAGLNTGAGVLLLREGEEVWLELKGGEWAESEDNIFAGLLLHRTT